MKKIIAALLVLLTLTSCSSETSDEKTIKVGASIAPHAEILEVIKDELSAKGYTLEVVIFTDYVLPNTTLDEGELDANYFQHLPYLEDFNANNGTNIVSAASVHFEPLGLYGGKTTDLAKLPEGGQVGIPSDASNGARALLLLEEQGIIKLKDGIGLSATVLDIIENPLNLEFELIESAQLPRSLSDLEIAVINGNYALSGEVTDSLIVTEDPNSEAANLYANIIAVNESELESDKTKALVDAILSDTVKEYINETYESIVLPVF